MHKKIKAWWCKNDPSNQGWYAEEYGENGEYLDDSMKIWFPVDLDQFKNDESQGVINALSAAFPDHEIYVDHEN